MMPVGGKAGDKWGTVLLFTLTLMLVAGFSLGPAGASEDSLLTGYPGPADHDLVASPIDLTGPDAYTIVHVRAHQDAPTILFALEDDEGELVMFAWGSWGQIRITHGYDPDDGSFRFIDAGWTHSSLPARHDVLIEGDTYRYQVRTGATGHGSIEAATITNANQAVFASEDRLEQLQELLWGTTGGRDTWNPRIVASSAVAAGFGDLASLDETAWSAWEPEGAKVTVEGNQDGDHGVGRLRVDSSWEAQPDGLLRHGAAHGLIPDGQLGYVHVEIPEHEGAYLVEASVRPWRLGLNQPGGVPDHQAVLAGTSGPLDEPMIHWAIVVHHGERIEQESVGTVPGSDRWQLSLIGPDGTRTIISPAWSHNHWHFVRALVDEDSGQITVEVADAGDAFRFTFTDLGESERIATGDVWMHHTAWTGGGSAYYDNLAVYPWEGEA